jgi:hypothetical protein
MSLVQTESRQPAQDAEEMRKFAGGPMIVQANSITQQAGLLLTGISYKKLFRQKLHILKKNSCMAAFCIQNINKYILQYCILKLIQ